MRKLYPNRAKSRSPPDGQHPNGIVAEPRRRRIAKHIVIWIGLTFCCASLQVIPTYAADVREIIRQGAITLRSDWAADPDYAYVERDEVQKNEQVTSKTFQVVMIAGSDYHLPVAINDQPLSADRKKSELEKLQNEVQRRNSESAEARRQRVENYKKQSDENGALLLEFPNSFTFGLVDEEVKRDHPAYMLAATPLKRTGPMSRAVKVLGGMHGKLWLDKEHFHVVRAECDVFTPVPIYGILAKVLPGTHIAIEMTPVTDSIWLISELSMELNLAKLLVFKGKQVTRSTYSEYRLNTLVVDELLKAGHP
jgi:hypothetical protein